MSEPGTALTPAPRHGTLVGRRIVLDCRWLGPGGAGRVTELLLAEFRSAPPPGRWLLWGDPRRLAPLRFPGSAVHRWRGSPTAWRGQRDLLRVPRGDVVVYLHQLRPLRPGRSVTVIHDTIPLHTGRLVGRLLRWPVFWLVARFSATILTDSEAARRDIARDLRVRPERVRVLRFPMDEARAERIAALRQTLPQQDTLVYVGRFAAHKNLRALVEAFDGSAFAARGGKLRLIGGEGDELRDLRRWVAARGLTNVGVEGQCTEAELDRLLATSRALVAPALAEGFGLPAFEAAACGLPVAASPTGAMPALPPGAAIYFDPRDVHAMRRAIDEVAARPTGPARRVIEPNLRDAVLDAVADALTSSR